MPSCFTRVCVLAYRMSDRECSWSDPLGLGDPYWQRLRSETCPSCVVFEGPTYVVASDVPTLAQVRLALDQSVPLRKIGACETSVLADNDLAHIEDWSAYVRLDLCFEQSLPIDEVEALLSPLPFKAYRVEYRTEPLGPDCSLLDFDWSDVLPNLEWRIAE